MDGVGIVRETVAVAVLGAGAGLLANLASPQPARLSRPVYAAAEAAAGLCEPPQASAAPLPRIAVAEATSLCEACSAAFVDARSAREYEAGHVAGAIHLPPVGHPDESAALSRLAGASTVVVYDGEASCALAEGVGRRLVALGFRDVRVLDGAWAAWLAGGGPGSSGACTVCDRARRAEASP